MEQVVVASASPSCVRSVFIRYEYRARRVACMCMRQVIIVLTRVRLDAFDEIGHVSTRRRRRCGGWTRADLG